ncbi:leucine--tRNA ligase [Myxococcus stipitatus]|uniref:leucine--tRNA ligase n=1 Tax=Myxococcus stipitatus TaxID=83455 RepID=UPI001EEF5302|nr:leucine--tRNA ligase [Myxococcus stipitatus]MCE9672947.1 leucine--tRNA ligase [Myxococcus stipitatus]
MAMNERYEPQSIEGKWQARWDEAGIFRAGKRPGAPKKYILEMLPYPSGKMHMGHVRNYLIGDVYARYFLMRGFDVLHPMGWDAFGLPAENAAIKDGVHPAVRTAENIASFKKEMKSLGYSYDWEREVNTSQPEYYRWNQWFFIKMLERGLVYRRFSKVNWCTGCLTVIANEQVKDGKCERCDSPVVDKEMPEWAFRITKYSQDLLDALDTLKEWPDRITAAQRNWIGRSDGAEAEFRVQGHDASIRVFTTRLDTVYGCTYVVLAPDHKLVAQVTTPERRADVDAFAKRMAAQSKTERLGEDAEKEGVFTGAHAINPFNGQPVPIWIANFVVSDYGTGAVMSVPAHDARDFAFARKYALPVKVVVQPATGNTLPSGDALEEPFTEYGVLVDSGEYTGQASEAARKAMAAKLEQEGRGRATVTYRQKDWGFSRQRYWGTPIPIVYCEKCDPERQGIPVPVEQLPVKLPEIDVQEVLTGKGEPPLAKVPSWVNTTCPKCGGPARREAETMDTFVDSCWYFARYLSPRYDAAPFDPKEAQRFLPVDVYVGGPEHAVMHLLYFRFWTRVMKLLGLIPVDEPVTRLITQGIVNGPDGRKMSKRWGNVVAPASITETYGADTARTYVMFAGPPERDFDWSKDQVEGVFRFLKRVWTLAVTHQSVAGATHQGPYEGKALETRRAAHKALKRVTEAIERLSFNTAIAGVMEYVNALYAVGTPETAAEKAAMAEAVQLLTVVLTPFAPHIADEIAEAYGAKEPVAARSWPAFDPALVVDDVIPYAVQVNGKLRAEIQVAADAGEADVRAAAEADERVRSAITGKTVRKFVFVPKRLVNFVVG